MAAVPHSASPLWQLARVGRAAAAMAIAVHVRLLVHPRLNTPGSSRGVIARPGNGALGKPDRVYGQSGRPVFTVQVAG